MLSCNFLRHLARRLHGCLVVLCLGLAGWPAAASPGSVPELVLGRGVTSAAAWPALRVLADPEARLDSAQALAALPRFQPPDGPYANLGARRGVTWVHLWLALDGDAPPTWMAWLDYPLLWNVSLQVYDARGQLVHGALLGSSVPFDRREQPTRALSSELRLQPGQRYQVLLRVDTPTATLLPLHFKQPSAMGVAESREQAVQGLMTGLWLFMIIYSLANWLHRRQGMFLAYAVSLLASWGFTLSFHGHGAQYLWPGQAWPAMNLALLAPSVMVMANVHFFVDVLDMRRLAPRTAQALHVVAALAAGMVLLYVAGRASYAMLSVGGMALGLLHLLLAMRVALMRVHQGDRAAAFLLAGSLCNVVGVAAVAALLRGALPVNFLSLHAVQIAFGLEMALWLMVLGARLEQLRQAAAEAQRQHERLHALAHTDALTGLRNRRGLEVALEAASQGSLAVFLLDLDGFKPVNDRWGHDVGDALLRQVGQRLQTCVRPTDVVARLGGDEFVVAVPGLRDAAAADKIGRKLRAQFERRFDLGEDRQGQVGATIGYAFAAKPGAGTANLLRAADAAMYRGKQAGKNMVMAAVS